MKKILKIFTVFVALLFVGAMFTTSSADLQIQDRNIDKEESEIDVSLKITKPKIGNLYVFGTNSSIEFLEEIGWAVVIGSELCIETEGAEKADYTVFNVTSNKGPSSVAKKFNKTVYEYPFGCCFDKIPTHFNYKITATAYHNDTSISSDSVSPVAFIKNPEVIG
ncbi:MAG: hypothetical protein V5A68_01550 [Candidatus Thermoplasmatota archaeon]